MNSDDFEKQLRRQPRRVLPTEWREEILQASQAQSPPRLSTLNSQPRPCWKALLWPCPQAWAGMAAAWVIILGLHLAAGQENHAAVQLTSIAASPEARAILTEQRRLYAELLSRPGAPVNPHPDEAVDRPRSQILERKDLPRTSLTCSCHDFA